jgi:hypothetical protein
VLRVHAESTSAEPVGREFSNIMIELALASLPGFTASSSPPSPGRAFGYYEPGYLPQTEVPHVVVLADGTRIDVPPPPTVVEVVAERPSKPGEGGFEATSGGSSTTERRPLGDLAYARSGDKGGDANVGVWIPAAAPNRDAAVAWLLDLLTPQRIQDLLPETADLAVEVYPFPNLGGVNILVRGILGRGVAASSRLDPQAKALGEWLRARHVDIPVQFLKESLA